MLSEELIKQVYFYCDEKLPNAIYADDLDIIQFAHKLEAVIAVEYARKEHVRCVAIVKDMNRAVGEALENQRPK
jgi:hypothetical protein